VIKPRIRRRFEPLADFELEAYLCDELAPEERARVERAFAEQPELRTYVEGRLAAREAFAAQHPLQLGSARGRSRRRLALGLGAGALAAAAALLLVLPLDAPAHPVRVDTVRIKGRSPLRAELFVKRGEQVWKFRPELGLRAGDRVRVVIEREQPGYLTLLGRDARGRVSVYYEGIPTAAGRYAVPDSLILDAQEGDEQWLLIVTPEPPAADSYRDGFARAELPEAEHALFMLHKESP
jgi:hypothetical protein